MFWEYCFDVLCEEVIDDSIYKYYDDNVYYGEIIFCYGVVLDVVLLYFNCLLFKLGNFEVVKFKGNVGG